VVRREGSRRSSAGSSSCSDLGAGIGAAWRACPSERRGPVGKPVVASPREISHWTSWSVPRLTGSLWRSSSLIAQFKRIASRRRACTRAARPSRDGDKPPARHTSCARACHAAREPDRLVRLRSPDSARASHSDPAAESGVIGKDTHHRVFAEDRTTLGRADCPGAASVRIFTCHGSLPQPLRESPRTPEYLDRHQGLPQ
jgi:hypothetical protein